jgi:cytoskeletal protein RodZ
MWLLNTGFHWWLRLTVAAFLLSAWVAVGLSSGIAHADDPSPSGTKSSSESAADAPKAAKADPSESTTTADETTDTKPTTVDQPSEPPSVASADPDDPPKPSARRGSPRPGLTIASAKPAKTA